MIEASRNAT